MNAFIKIKSDSVSGLTKWINGSKITNKNTIKVTIFDNINVHHSAISNNLSAIGVGVIG